MKEEGSQVRKRMQLNILVERDGMSATGAAAHMERAPSWGVKWRRHYLDERGRRSCGSSQGPKGRRAFPGRQWTRYDKRSKMSHAGRQRISST